MMKDMLNEVFPAPFQLSYETNPQGETEVVITHPSPAVEGRCSLVVSDKVLANQAGAEMFVANKRVEAEFMRDLILGKAS